MTSSHPRPLLMVSCRHCLRPITLASEVNDQERAALQRHLRGCAVRAPIDEGPDADAVLRHFRIVDTL